MSRIISLENWFCPECKENFSEIDLQGLLNDPFNGVVIVCLRCNKEYSVDLLIKLEEV